MPYIYTVREQIFTAQIEIGDELENTETLQLVNNQLSEYSKKYNYNRNRFIHSKYHLMNLNTDTNRLIRSISLIQMELNLKITLQVLKLTRSRLKRTKYTAPQQDNKYSNTHMLKHSSITQYKLIW